jgi:hypothetical protein
MLLYHLSHLVSWEAPTKKKTWLPLMGTLIRGGRIMIKGEMKGIRLRRNENRNGKLHVAERGCEKNVGLLSKGEKVF